MQVAHHIREMLSTPGPASQLGDTAVVDDDKDHWCVGCYLTPQVKPEVKRLGFEITHQGRLCCDRIEHEKTDRAQQTYPESCQFDPAHRTIVALCKASMRGSRH